MRTAGWDRGDGAGRRRWAGLAGALFVASLLLWSLVSAPVRLLEAEGVTGHASVLSLQAGPGSGTPMVEVLFAGPEGEGVRARVAVSAAFHAGLQVGGEVPVRFAASDPAIVELEPGALARPARMAGWLVLLAGLAFGVALLRAVRPRPGRTAAEA